MGTLAQQGWFKQSQDYTDGIGKLYETPAKLSSGIDAAASHSLFSTISNQVTGDIIDALISRRPLTSSLYHKKGGEQVAYKLLTEFSDDLHKAMWSYIENNSSDNISEISDKELHTIYVTTISEKYAHQPSLLQALETKFEDRIEDLRRSYTVIVAGINFRNALLKNIHKEEEQAEK